MDEAGDSVCGLWLPSSSFDLIAVKRGTGLCGGVRGSPRFASELVGLLWTLRMLLEVFPFNFSVVCCIFGLRLKAEILRGLAFYCLDPQDTWSFWSNCAFGSGSGVALLHPGWFFSTKCASIRRTCPWSSRESTVWEPLWSILKNYWSCGLVDTSLACPLAEQLHLCTV